MKHDQNYLIGVIGKVKSNTKYNYSEWRHHDVLENQLVLHKRTSAQSI